VATTGQVIGIVIGSTGDGHQPGTGYRSNLNSLQNALAEADQLVQNHHLKHLYVSMDADYYTLQPMAYLAEHTHTPTTLFNDQCLMLPDPTYGPAALLVGPYNELTNILLSHFASATLINEPTHTGGDPFKLYIINTPVVHATMQASFPREMQLLNTQQFNFQNTPWVATRWNILHSLSAEDQTIYSYGISNLSLNPDSANREENRQCVFTSMQTGDQLLAAFPLSSGSQKPTSLNIQIQASKITPLMLDLHLFGSLDIPFETGFMEFSPATLFQTSGGKDNLVIPFSNQKIG